MKKIEKLNIIPPNIYNSHLREIGMGGIDNVWIGIICCHCGRGFAETNSRDLDKKPTCPYCNKEQRKSII